MKKTGDCRCCDAKNTIMYAHNEKDEGLCGRCLKDPNRKEKTKAEKDKAAVIKELKEIAKPKPIARRSVKRSKEEREYAKLRKKFLGENPLCVLAVEHDCTIHATEVHHSKGRIGELLLAVEHFIPVCHNGHVWAESHPIEAKELGISQSRLQKQN